MYLSMNGSFLYGKLVGKYTIYMDPMGMIKNTLIFLGSTTKGWSFLPTWISVSQTFDDMTCVD